MVDTVDLLVAGAYFGTGRKAGLLTTFLMCTLDKKTKTW